MNKISITALVLLTALTTLIMSCSKDKEQPEQQELTIVSFLGDVNVTSKDGTIPAKAGLKINEGDIIKAGALSSVDISIGKNGVARISENTILNVEKIATRANGGEMLRLDRGRVSVVISRLTKDSDFTVKTPMAIAAIRGTGFRVSAGNGTSKIEVVSGKVLVSPVKEGIIIDTAAVVVEKNGFVAVDDKKAAAAEKGEPLKVETIPAAEIKSISDEMKALTVSPSAAEPLRDELKSIIEPVEELKEMKDDKDADAAKKDAALRNAQEREKVRLEAEKQKELKDKEDAEKLAVAQKEAADKAAAEKEAKAEQEKKVKKEARVKNIPTI